MTYPLAFEPDHRTPADLGDRVQYFAFHERKLLVQETHALIGSLGGLTVVRTQFLGRLDGVSCVAAELAAPEAPPGHRFRDLRALFGRLDPGLLAVAGRAVQLVEWERTHQFCGACAQPTVRSERDRSRMCPVCQTALYPRLAPAMIVAVERDDRILLGRSPHFPPGIFSTLAGFVDPGESAEEAVIREVYEETRIVVDQVRYFGSQAWPFPHSLMLGFTARYVAGEIDVEADELEAAGWYSVHDLPPTFPGNVSISQWLLADFIRRKTPGSSTPVGS